MKLEEEEDEWSKEQEANRKPGQKHPTPSPGFADRVFYESLLQQVPTSRMAKKWCLEYGVLKWAEAEALCKELGVPVKVSRSVKSPSNSKRSKTASTASIKNEASVAQEIGLHGETGGYEGVGLSVL